MTGDKGGEQYLSLFNLKGIISKDKEAEAEQADIEEKEHLLRYMIQDVAQLYFIELYN